MTIKNSTSPAVFRWRPACWLRVTGDDAANFLQGQFTNDLRTLKSERAVYGLWLTVRGKVLADSFILRLGATNEFWILSYFCPASTVRERLESHVIADDVLIEDFTEAWRGVSILGPTTFDLTQLASNPASGLAFRGRRGRELNFECVYPIASGEPAWLTAAAQPATEIDADEIASRRIDAGIPAIPADIGPADLPNEGGLDRDAISYTKGCYLGQEVMARLKSMGQVRRRLLRVRGLGENFPAPPAPVFAGSRQVGELRSAAGDGAGGWVGLAMVSLLHVTTDTALAFSLGGTPALRLMDAP